jgi:hypothetical protein
MLRKVMSAVEECVPFSCPSPLPPPFRFSPLPPSCLCVLRGRAHAASVLSCARTSKTPRSSRCCAHARSARVEHARSGATVDLSALSILIPLVPAPYTLFFSRLPARSLSLHVRYSHCIFWPSLHCTRSSARPEPKPHTSNTNPLVPAHSSIISKNVSRPIRCCSRAQRADRSRAARSGKSCCERPGFRCNWVRAVRWAGQTALCCAARGDGVGGLVVSYVFVCVINLSSELGGERGMFRGDMTEQGC